LTYASMAVIMSLTLFRWSSVSPKLSTMVSVSREKQGQGLDLFLACLGIQARYAHVHLPLFLPGFEVGASVDLEVQLR
jgi:hypothetical protein